MLTHSSGVRSVARRKFTFPGSYPPSAVGDTCRQLTPEILNTCALWFQGRSTPYIYNKKLQVYIWTTDKIGYTLMVLGKSGYTGKHRDCCTDFSPETLGHTEKLKNPPNTLEHIDTYSTWRLTFDVRRASVIVHHAALRFTRNNVQSRGENFLIDCCCELPTQAHQDQV